VLRCGCGAYDDAVVVSVNPFVLISREADMRWKSTVNREHFVVTGEADKKTLARCLSRLERDAKEDPSLLNNGDVERGSLSAP